MNLARHVRDKKQLVLLLNGTPSFDPSCGEIGAGFFRWNLGDGNVIPDDNSFTHVYADTNQYEVRADKRYNRFITSLQIFSDDLVEADLTHMIGVGGSTSGAILLQNNGNLVKLIMPQDHVATGFVTQMRLENCDITGAFDLGGLFRVGGLIWLSSNSNLTSVDFSGPYDQTGSDFTSVQVNVCSSLVTANLTGMINMRALVTWNNCPNLNAILFPNNLGVSSGVMTTMNGYQCPSITTLAFGNFENVGGNFRVYQCSSLFSLTFPASPTAKFTEFRVEQCDLPSVDISQFSLTGQVRFHTNPNLTSFLAPTVTGADNTTLFWGYNCDITGVLDLTPMENLRGSILLYNNTAMTGITFEGTPKPLNTSNMQIYNCDLTGTLDISMFTGLSGRVYLHSNSNLTQITNPTSSGVFTEYHAYSCDLTGTLDVSGLSGLGASFEVFSNPNLTDIDVPVSSENFSEFLAYSCDLTGNLDLTGLTGGFRVLQLYFNPNLTGITFDPAMNQTANNVVSWRIHDCDLTGTLDLSPVDKLGGLFWAYNNPNLTGITFPTSSVAVTDFRVYNTGLTSVDFSSLSGFAGRIEFNGNALTSVTFPTLSAGFSNFFFQNNTSLGYIDLTPLTGSTFSSVSVSNNGMNAAEVNQMLVEFDGMVGVVGSGTFTITNNAVPDAVSGGFDGLAAKASLQGKGWTVNTD